MEITELETRAPGHRRSLLLIAAFLLLTALAALPSVGAGDAPKTVDQGGVGSQSESLSILTDPTEVTLPSTSTTVVPVTTSLPTRTTMMPTRLAPSTGDDEVVVDPFDVLAPEQPTVKPDPRILQYPLPRRNAYPMHIVAGPDGALWFTENGPDSNFDATIGRLTTDGELTEFDLPNEFQTAVGLVVGPDNALWFVDANSPRAGRLTVEGSLALFDTGWRAADDMVVGSDGALWFVASRSVGNPDHMTGHLIRMTLAGDVSVFDLDAWPGPLALGPDGNVWWAEGRGLWRVTPGGQATNFAAPPDCNGWAGGLVSFEGALSFGCQGQGTPDGPSPMWWVRVQPNGETRAVEIEPMGMRDIVVGPDRHLWVSTGGDAIVRMTPEAEVVDTFKVYRPAGIAIGPDDNLWFVNDLGAKVGRVRTDDL